MFGYEDELQDEIIDLKKEIETLKAENEDLKSKVEIEADVDDNPEHIMQKFQTGNVVKLKGGSIVIVTEVNDEVTQWVSFDYSNSSGCTSNKTTYRTETCWDCYSEDEDYGCPDPECETCHGVGQYKRKYPGMDTAKLLAETVKDYIINGITKNFKF